MLTLQHTLLIQNKALELAIKQGVNIAIAITDTHGELMTFLRMDDVSLHACVLAKNKAYTAARDRQTTKSLARWAQETGKDLSYWTDPRITGIAGGVPIIVAGKVMGAIGISGLAEDDDETLAYAALEVIS
ncbi:GlcG/HbpS family heme-binding protein [Algibacillus agarilyticus]|uniref:GlcG/HbpS family heme-binding protein n=1 Tax=Algibacillus agarilyticus TaxID=2234133 RepID=UPI000DD013B9|nr:heme-binding protein [Algibacillus agarilyticus]